MNGSHFPRTRIATFAAVLSIALLLPASGIFAQGKTQGKYTAPPSPQSILMTSNNFILAQVTSQEGYVTVLPIDGKSNPPNLGRIGQDQQLDFQNTCYF